MEIKVDLAKLRPLQQDQSPEQILPGEPVQITSLSDLEPFIEGLSDLNANELDNVERAAFWKNLWSFGATLTQQLDRRREPPSEAEIISVAAARLLLEPDFFTARYLPASVIEKVTRDICLGRDRSRPIWKMSPSYEIVTSEYRDELGEKFVQRISEISTP